MKNLIICNKCENLFFCFTFIEIDSSERNEIIKAFQNSDLPSDCVYLMEQQMVQDEKF